MKVDQDNLDRILAEEDELMPSSGFVASVMGRVCEEAAAPAPIPFPWKRIWPGMAISAGLLGWCAVELGRQGLPDLHAVAQKQPHLAMALMQSSTETGWVVVALGISLLSWLLAKRFAGR